ncbi:MAG: NUDIX hydrolase [Sphingobium sp.]
MSDQPALAATLIVVRDHPAGGAPQYLMAERSASMAFAAGALVFPGGRVDEQDHDFARSLDPEAADRDDLSARIAALRETIEECGLGIGAGRSLFAAEEARAVRDALQAGQAFAEIVREMDLTPGLGDLVPFTRWCPPSAGNLSRRFDTRFYIAAVSEQADALEPDGGETVTLEWLTAQDALDRAAGGEAKLIFPTRRNLERLAQCPSVEELLAHARAHEPALISPRVERRDGVDYLCIPEGLGYPVTSEPLETVKRG